MHPARVSVCIPVYFTGCHIEETVRSVLEQTFQDWNILIAIEPPHEDLLNRLTPFLPDDRIKTFINPLRLGWAENTRSLLQRVETPYFMILPHDDMLSPVYLERLLALFTYYPDASVVYADMGYAGKKAGSCKFVDLPRDGDRSEQLLAYFLSGAEAVPWRGVTRASMVQSLGGFPVDDYQGLAVECEWACSLVAAGRAVRVPEPLYIKRIHPPEVISASRARLYQVDRERLERGWFRHREVMLSIVSGAGVGRIPQDLIFQAVEAAMLRRRQDFIGERLPEDCYKQCMHQVELLSARVGNSGQSQAVLGKFHLVLARHALAEGQVDRAVGLINESLGADPDNQETLRFAQRLKNQMDA